MFDLAQFPRDQTVRHVATRRGVFWMMALADRRVLWGFDENICGRDVAPEDALHWIRTRRTGISLWDSAHGPVDVPDLKAWKSDQGTGDYAMRA